MIAIRQAEMPRDRDAVAALWLEYLTWGNDGLETRFGFRLSVDDAVEQDLRSVAKFEPPDGRLLLAADNGEGVGTASMQRIGPDTAEIKRMFVSPRHRRGGVGRAMLDQLIGVAAAAGYQRLRLDSPDFMTAAHDLYRSRGFVMIEPYAESEIPDEHKAHWVFMELTLVGRSASASAGF